MLQHKSFLNSRSITRFGIQSNPTNFGPISTLITETIKPVNNNYNAITTFLIKTHAPPYQFIYQIGSFQSLSIPKTKETLNNFNRILYIREARRKRKKENLQPWGFGCSSSWVNGCVKVS